MNVKVFIAARGCQCLTPPESHYSAHRDFSLLLGHMPNLPISGKSVLAALNLSLKRSGDTTYNRMNETWSLMNLVAIIYFPLIFY
jgi:hypothetical protein